MMRVGIVRDVRTVREHDSTNTQQFIHRYTCDKLTTTIQSSHTQCAARRRIFERLC